MARAKKKAKIKQARRKTMLVCFPNPFGNGIDQLSVAIDETYAYLFQTKRIEESHYRIARDISSLFIRRNIGLTRSIDYAQDRVDASGKGDPVNDIVLSATENLNAIKKEIGEPDYEKIIIPLLENNDSITSVANNYCRVKKASKNHISKTIKAFCEVLELIDQKRLIHYD